MAFVYQILGFLLILTGLALVWTPIPVGLIILATGIALVVGGSDRASAFVRRRRM